MKNKYCLMTKTLFCTIWIFALIISGFNFALAQNKTESAKPAKQINSQPKFAFLVGITNFKNKTIPKIDGCQNNVLALAETLIKDYGFSEKNVVTLLDEKATKAGIIDGFRSNLIENAKKAKADGKEAVIVYYFCGHGSQFPDQDNDENDGKDETFVAYDSRTGDVFDILDDEIDDLKSELRPFTKNTTLIFESCHSGTGSRGDNDGKFISQEVTDYNEKPKTPYKRKYPPTADSDAGTYTEIAASLSINTAKSESAEYCECEKPMSLMTKALVQGLKRATYSTTYRGLIREVSAEVATQSRQEPQVEGNRDAVIFGGEAKRAKPYIEIEKILPENEIAIRAGKIHGLKVGSQISVYSSESLTNTGEEGWLTNGTVTQVGNTVAVVELPKENPKIKEIKNTSHVVLASPVFGGGSILLALNPNGTKKVSENEIILDKNIEANLKKAGLIESQIVKLVPSDKISKTESESAKGIIRLRKGKFGEVFLDKNRVNPLKEQTYCDGDVLRVYSEAERYPADKAEVYYLDDGESGGTPLFGKTFDPADENAAEDVADAVRNFAYQKTLREFDNAASTLASQIKVTLEYIPDEAIIETCKNGKKEFNENAEKYKGFQTIENNSVSVNSYFFLKIKNISGEIRKKVDEFAAGEPFYISVIGLTNSGEIKNFYGSKGANDSVQDGKEIGINIKTTEPIGVERYIIIISKDYVDFSFYESRGVRRDAKSILEKMLTQSGQRTRSSGLVIKDEPNQWDIINVELNITDEKK